MAFPQVRSTVGTNTAVNGTSKTITLPPTISAGDLLLICLVCDGVPNITWPGGWTQVKDLNGAQVRLYVATKDTAAAGTEDGTTISITLSATEMHAARSWAIFDYDTAVGPEFSTGYNPGVNTANPDPDALTPSWGADDTLWIAFEGYDVGTSTVTAYPTTYPDNRLNDRGNAAAGAGLGVASRNLNAASDDPGTFTNSASSRAVAVTIGIKPVGAAPSVSPQKPIRINPAIQRAATR